MTTTRPRPDACLVRLAGEVDLDTAPMLGAYLRTHTAAKPTYLLLDLCEVNLLAAAGLTVIVTAQREDHSIHGDLRVIGVPSNRAVARVLRITATDTSLRIHPTVADALDAIDKLTQN
jgi:anti-sigma B factor antagonist